MTDEVQDGEMYWQYRRFRIPLDDGYVYGMCEAHFICDNGKMLLQFWSENPLYTANQPDDLVVMVDRLEEAHEKDGTMPEWAAYYTPEDFKLALQWQRRACTEPVIDEEEIYRSWGE